MPKIMEVKEMNEDKDEVFYKLNAPFRVGVRTDLKDTEGTLLSPENPYFSVYKGSDHRKFLAANKVALQKGLIVETTEPPLEIITSNSITDEEALDLVKNFHQLRKRLPEITSEVTVGKLLAAAKASKRSEATLKLIMDRFEEISPNVMQSVS